MEEYGMFQLVGKFILQGWDYKSDADFIYFKCRNKEYVALKDLGAYLSEKVRRHEEITIGIFQLGSKFLFKVVA